MDINCTNNCVYQSEGKCTLNELPQLISATYTLEEGSCPYCSSTAVHNSNLK